MEKSFFNRLRRVEGQLRRLQQSIEEQADCADVIPQFLAVKGAIASAFEEYVHQSLAECTKQDVQKMERLITLIVKS